MGKISVKVVEVESWRVTCVRVAHGFESKETKTRQIRYSEFIPDTDSDGGGEEEVVLKNQSVYGVWGRSCCLFSDKYRTHKYCVGRMCNS